MRIPYKPNKPIEPKKRIVLIELTYSIPIGVELTIKELTEQAIKAHNYINFQNFSNTGEWKIVKIKTEDNGGGWDDSSINCYAILTGGELSYDNSSYDYQYKKYQKALKEYPAKLQKYQKAIEEYENWKKNIETRQKATAKSNLTKQINQLKKQLEKII